jgi:Tol biopolymer transport system component
MTETRSTRSSRTRALLALLCLVLAASAAEAQRWREKRQERRARREATATAATGINLASRITVIKQAGGRMDWVDSKIAFDMQAPGGAFEVYVMRPDGTDTKCLTCGLPDLPHKNNGQPSWDPSGRYLVFQAEKAAHRRLLLGHAATPGGGVLNDLWVLDTSTNRATMIREVADAPGQGTLHPHFSSDGTMLSWSEMKEKSGLESRKQLGYWQLMVADFRVTGGRPTLANVRGLSPGGQGFYENHGFSPDGSRLIFTSNFEGRGRLDYDIYVVDLRTQKLTRLTTDGYNEHANYSPDGRYIAWMSNVGISGAGTDYWIMNSDGSNKRRVTHFNEKGHPEYQGRATTVADLSWRPDGTAFAAYIGGKVIMEPTKDPIRTVLVELRPEAIGRTR